MKLTKKNSKKVKEGNKVKCIIKKGAVDSFGIQYDVFEQLKGRVLKGEVNHIYEDGDIEVLLDVPESIETRITQIYYLTSCCSEVYILI